MKMHEYIVSWAWECTCVRAASALDAIRMAASEFRLPWESVAQDMKVTQVSGCPVAG